MRLLTRSLIMVLFCFTVLSVVPINVQCNEFDLTILHTNDVHAHLDQFNSFGLACNEDDYAKNTCFGGVARQKTMIDQIRSENENVLLLDAGDQFQGTLFYAYYKGDAAQETMNLLGYEAMAVGNHEFDDGPINLARFIDKVNFPVLSANIDSSAEPSLIGKIQPYTILEVGDGRIGIVGYITEQTSTSSSPGPNVTFETIEVALPPAIEELESMGINKIIAVSHAGFNRDCQVAANITGLDIIVGGHTHTLLSNTEPGASGPYPVVVNASDGNPTLVVTDYCWGKYLGRLDVTFDRQGVVTNYSGNPILLNKSVAQDSMIQSRVDELSIPIKNYTNKVIGYTTTNLNGDSSCCRFGECTMGNVITDAMLWKTHGQGTQIAIVQGGGIRASILAGNITVAQVMAVLPFGNSIVTFELTGSEILEALESGTSLADNINNGGTGRFPQVAGMRYAWDPLEAIGSRIIGVEVRNSDGTYSPIDANATYKLVSISFLCRGGDGYDVFVNAPDSCDTGLLLCDAVREYISQHSPIEPQLEGRIIKVEPSIYEGDTYPTINSLNG